MSSFYQTRAGAGSGRDCQVRRKWLDAKMTSLWLNLFQGAPGFDTPFLHEYLGPYRYFDRNCDDYPQIILLIKGQESHCSPKAERGVQLRQVRLPLCFIAECSLHEQPHLQRVKPGFLPPNIRQYHLEERRPFSSADLAYSLYSRLLSPFSNVVVFFEGDHGGMAPILRILASWIWFTPDDDCQWQRPAVLIFRSSHLGADASQPSDIENELAFVILQHFNHQKTLSFHAARSAWEKSFASITALPTGTIATKSPLRQMLDESALIQQGKVRSGNAFSAGHFKKSFRAACAAFAGPDVRALDLFEACRVDHPLPGQMPFHVEQVARMLQGDESRSNLPIRLIASALVSHSYDPSLHRTCAPDALSSCRSLFTNLNKGFPPKKVFTRLYMSFLEEIQFRRAMPNFVELVQAEFVRLASSSRPNSPADPLGSGMLQQHQAPSTCFPCLARIPSITLTCGHRLCDTCAEKHGLSSFLESCPVCSAANQVSFYAKPAAAGVRVLRVGGELEHAAEVAIMLKNLRSQLSGPLHHYFDIVFCSGVGIFFAIMLFCQNASIEDCMYHLKSLNRLKVRRNGFAFGSRLKFSLSELQRSPTKLVACFKDLVASSYP